MKNEYPPRARGRLALSLAVMALYDVAERTRDVETWAQAAGVLQAMLAELRGPCPAWVPYSPAHSPRRRKNENGA